MNHDEVQRAARELQKALGLAILCGQITLNINQGDVDTYDVREKKRVPPKKGLDPRYKQAQA
jgi:hypothetical protein